MALYVPVLRTQPTPRARPNVVLIITDDMGQAEAEPGRAREHPSRDPSRRNSPRTLKAIRAVTLSPSDIRRRGFVKGVMIEATLTGQSPGAPGYIERPSSLWTTRNPVSDSAMPAPREAASTQAALPAAVSDRAAERALYEQHVDRIFRLALRMTGNAELAEDLTQDVFMRAFERLHQFRGESGLGTWLHRVAISVILNAMAKRKAAAAREVPAGPVRGRRQPVPRDRTGCARSRSRRRVAIAGRTARRGPPLRRRGISSITRSPT